MFKNLVIASAGFVAGGAFVVIQIMNGRIVVDQDENGNISVRSKSTI